MILTDKQKEDLARRVATGEITEGAAMDEYGVGHSMVEHLVRQYKVEHGMPVRPPKTKSSGKAGTIQLAKKEAGVTDADLAAYQAMTKDELINALILAQANILRAKKGYEVKGDGQNREYISLKNKNTK
jgi:transposase